MQIFWQDIRRIKAWKRFFYYLHLFIYLNAPFLIVLRTRIVSRILYASFHISSSIAVLITSNRISTCLSLVIDFVKSTWEGFFFKSISLIFKSKTNLKIQYILFTYWFILQTIEILLFFCILSKTQKYV